MYAEDIFLINTIIDLIILLICRQILKSPKQFWRLLLAATFGGIYTILFLYFDFNYLLGKFLSACILVLIAFGFSNILEFTRKYIAFLIITYCLGGSIYGFISLFGISGFNFPIKTFIFAVIFTFITTIVASLTLDKRKKIEKSITPLTIHHNNRQITIPCLKDTGNETGFIIAELGKLRKILPHDFCLDIAEHKNILDIFEKWGNALNLKALPYNSLGCSGILIGFEADNPRKTIGIFRGKLTPTEMYNAIS